LRLESLEDRRMLAYTVSETGTAGNETLVISKATADTANLTMTSDALGEITISDPGNTFTGSPLTGVTFNSNSIVISPAEAGVVHLDFDLSHNNTQINNFIVGDLSGATIPGFDVNSMPGSADGIILEASSINTGSSSSAAASIHFNYARNVIIDSASVTIKTAQLATDSPGSVNFGSATVSAAAGNKNLTIDTSTSTASTAGGNVILTSLTNAGGHYSYVNNLTVNTGAGSGGTAGTISLDGNFDTAGSQLYDGPVLLANIYPMTLNSSSDGESVGSGNITFGSTVTGELLLSATLGTSPLLFVTDGTPAPNQIGGDLTVSTLGVTTFGGTVNIGSLNVQGGTIEIDTNSITTTTTQEYGGPVSLVDGNVTFTSDGSGASGNITFDWSVNLGAVGGAPIVAGGLTVSTAGTTAFDQNVGSNTTGLDSIPPGFGNSSPVIGDGILAFVDVTNGPTLITSAGYAIATSSTQYYAGAVTVVGETTLVSTGTGANGAITFGSTVNGGPIDLYDPVDLGLAFPLAGSLTISTAGLTRFEGAVGSSATSAGFESISVTGGPTEIDGGSISTLGTQSYAGAVTISQETTLKSTGTGAAGAITFGSTVDGIGTGLDTLHVVTAGLTTFGGAVGGSASSPDIEALDVQVGPAQIEGGTISTRSVQYYGNPVTITQETSLTSSRGEWIDFNSTLDSSGGRFTLHSITTGLTTFNGAVGGSVSSPDIEALDVQVGPALIAGGSVATRSVQYYGGAVTLAHNAALTSTGGEWIEFHSTVDTANSSAGLTITTSYPYTNDSGSPQLFNAAVGGHGPLGYLAANVEGGIVLNSPIRTTGDMLLGGTTLMPAVLQVNADLFSSLGSIGLTSSMRVFTSIGDTISAPTGTITFSAGSGSSGQSLVALYSTMQTTGVFVTGGAASNQLQLQPLGTDLLVNESGINSGTIGSYQGVETAVTGMPFVQYTNEQNIALEYSPGTESTSTLSIFTASNGSPTAVTNAILPIASFDPTSTSAAANKVNFYLEDNDITNVDVRVGRGNQTVDASQTNANTLLEGDAYQEAGVSDTLMGGRAYNVLIGGQSQATLVAGDGADINLAIPAVGVVGSPPFVPVANYIFTHYEYTVAGGVGQWTATPTSIGGTPVVDTVNGSATTQNQTTTNEVVTNGADVINASGIMLTSGQATINSSPSSNTIDALTQANVDAVEQAAIETIFPQATSGSSVFSSSSSPAGTQVVAAIPINYSPTPTAQSTDYAAPPVFYIPAQYASGRTPLLISDPLSGDTIHVDYNSDGTQVTISAAGFTQTWNTSLFSSIQIAANGNAVEVSAAAGNMTFGSIDAQSKQAYASIQYITVVQPIFVAGAPPITPPSYTPSIYVSGAQKLTINNESGISSSGATLLQLASSVSVVGQSELTDGSSSIALNNYGKVTINSNYARP
jgi:hypothetical protein